MTREKLCLTIVEVQKPKTEHIKKRIHCFFKKTIATIASILGLITASITIMNAFDKEKDKKDTNPQTTIIKEVQKEAPAESNTPAQNQTNNQETTQKEEVQTPSKKEDTKSDNNSQKMSNLILLQTLQLLKQELAQITEHLKHFSIPTITSLVFYLQFSILSNHKKPGTSVPGFSF